MTTYKDFFGTKYPIMAAPMNQVSELGLAIAVSKAGGIPSLTAFNYFWSGSLGIHPPLLETLLEDIKSFREQTNNGCLLLSIGIHDLFNRETVDKILSTGLRHFEVVSDFTTDTTESWNKTFKAIDYLKSQDCKVLIKTAGTGIYYPGDNGKVNEIKDVGSADGFIVKGPAAAGRVSISSTSLTDNLRIIRSKHPGKLVVPAGGIGLSSHVKFFMNQGVLAVAAGTLFAASKESIVSEATKLKMVEAGESDIQRLKGSSQNGLIFTRYEQDDSNYTYSLKNGIKDPSSGHIFAGKSIVNVTEIRSVHDIIQDLVKEL